MSRKPFWARPDQLAKVGGKGAFLCCLTATQDAHDYVPLFRRTPEDRETLLAAAEICEVEGFDELTAKLREMAGEGT